MNHPLRSKKTFTINHHPNMKQNRRPTYILPTALIILLVAGCTSEIPQESPVQESSDKMRVIFDTDANNELDDQHALTYLLFNGDTFDVEGVTVNATVSGGAVENHYDEAERILKLSTVHPRIPLFKGANGSFVEIRDQTEEADFDGADAVNFIIEQALVPSERPLIMLAVGKLTNVALAYKKNPAIAENMVLFWLGSNYPEPGEYNQDGDTTAMNFLLESDLPFSIATVRYGKPSGTDAVQVTFAEIQQRMPGLGPTTETPVMGRHGVAYSTFGDYSVNLFEHIDYNTDPPARALYDMAAVAILKNPAWATARRMPAPILRDSVWVDRPDNPRQIELWENFDRDAIIADFYAVMENYVLVDGG